MSELSQRGQHLLDSSPVAAYVSEHFARVAEPWDAQLCPHGYISLCIAENKLNSQGLIEQLSRYEVPASVLGYDMMSGNPRFRGRLAAFMGRTFLGRTFDAQQLVVVAGAGAVLEMLYYTICDPGDGVLIPTPSYSGFWPDLETRDELTVVPVDCRSEEDFRLTLDRLDAAFDSADCRIKALLFTTPNNPLGRVYTPEELLEIVGWCRSRGLQLVVDEIYALSVFGETPFTSVASLLPSLGPDIHIVWAFSKDFGASGLRCGVLVSENPEVLEVVGGLAYWSACSGHTQHLLSELVSDETVVDAQLSASRSKLAEAYARVTRGLDEIGIAYLPAQAAFFLICDLREYLEVPTWAAERALWRRILDEANVNLTPGEACRIHEPGFFRLCYAAERDEAVGEALRRLGEVLKRVDAP
jgi:aspartate/methionine/tyrosine aminotransferase